MDLLSSKHLLVLQQAENLLSTQKCHILDSGLWNKVNNNKQKTQRHTLYTLITLWMLCTIVLNLRPALFMRDLIYIDI